VVDYVQLLADEEGDGRSRERNVSAAATALKTLAGELGVPVLALVQLNRNRAGRADKSGGETSSASNEVGPSNNIKMCHTFEEVFGTQLLVGKPTVPICQFTMQFKQVTLKVGKSIATN